MIKKSKVGNGFCNVITCIQFHEYLIAHTLSYFQNRCLTRLKYKFFFKFTQLLFTLDQYGINISTENSWWLCYVNGNFPKWDDSLQYTLNIVLNIADLKLNSISSLNIRKDLKISLLQILLKIVYICMSYCFTFRRRWNE